MVIKMNKIPFDSSNNLQVKVTKLPYWINCGFFNKDFDWVMGNVGFLLDGQDDFCSTKGNDE